jgi:MYXO-CTERM domain-containing protein
MRAPALLLLAVLLPGTALAQDPAPAGGAEDAAREAQVITFYGHVFGNGYDSPMPANTIPPTGDALQSTWQDHQCFDDPTGQVASPCDQDPINKLILFATAGPVQVHRARDFNYSALHNERGHAKDVYLDKAKDVTAVFYAAADYFSWPLVCQNGGGLPSDVGCPWPQWGWDPGIIPGFTVEATLYQATLGEYGQGASEPPPIAEAIPTAEVIAHGVVGPQDLKTGLPGSPNVQEFSINLGPPLVDIIPKENDFFLVFNWYELVNGQKVGVEYMKPWSGELFPTRFTLPVRNPFDVELVIPQFLHDKLVVHGVLSTPWGSYDMDLASVGLDIRDSAGQPVRADHLTRFGDYSVAHGAHFTPVNITWVWDYKADGVRPGAFSATVRGCNFQHTACSETPAVFELRADGSPGRVSIGRSGQQTATAGLLARLEEGAAGLGGEPVGQTQAPPAQGPAPAKTPGPELGLVLLGLAGLALARRRA